MATESQINANQQNAQKSTGPQTAVGKKLQKILPKDLCKVNDDPRGAGPEFVLGRATIKDLLNSRVLDRLIMYERRIEHSLFKTMAELQRLQLLRQLQEAEICEAEPDQAIHKACGFEAAARRRLADLKKTNPIKVTF